jgi:O-antigen ligase
MSHYLARLTSIFSMPAILLAWRQKPWFYVFLFVSPIMPMPEALSIGGIPPIAIIVALLVFSMVINLSVDRNLSNSVRKLGKIGIFLFLYSLVLFSDIYWLIMATNRPAELPFLLGRFIFISIMIITYLNVDSEEEYVKCLRLVSYGVAVLSTLTIISSLFHVGIGFVRPARTYGITMPFDKAIGVPMSGGEFSIICIFALALFLSDTLGKTTLFKSRRISILFLLILLLAIVISQSRNAWLSTAVTLSLFSGLTLRAKRMTLLLMISLIIVIASLFSSEVMSIATMLQGEGIYSKNVMRRLDSFIYAVNIMRSNLALGYGHTYFQEMWARYSGAGEIVLHNNFLYQLVSGGLICFLPYLSIFAITIYLLRMNPSPLSIQRNGLYLVD